LEITGLELFYGYCKDIKISIGHISDLEKQISHCAKPLLADV